MTWNEHIASLPGAHLLQTSHWAQVKEKYGWKPHYLAWESASKPYVILRDPNLQPATCKLAAACLILQRAIPIGGFAARLSVLYAPKGPLLDWSDIPLRQRVLSDLRDFAQHRGAIFLKVDPDLLLGTGIPGSQDNCPNDTGQAVLAELQAGGWRFSDEQIQFRNTALIDLTPSEEQLLAQMKQKTRYNIRLAERKGVTVRVGTPTDYGLLYRMYAETSVRDGFVIRDEAYYRTVWSKFQVESCLSDEPSTFNLQPSIEPLIAEVEGEPVAAVVIFRFAGRAWYLYGMSRDAHREKMPNYLLQWEAIRRAKAAGCTIYDLWGAPDVFDESDAMWGVFRFKEGLGGQVARTLGAWDLPVRPFYYKLYTQILPQILDVMRRRGRQRTRSNAQTQP
jgi:lipid II:glycine glycyltransferase (peptidoglycan interpeptide bridge formation enzyme)